MDHVIALVRAADGDYQGSLLTLASGHWYLQFSADNWRLNGELRVPSDNVTVLLLIRKGWALSAWGTSFPNLLLHLTLKNWERIPTVLADGFFETNDPDIFAACGFHATSTCVRHMNIGGEGEVCFCSLTFSDAYLERLASSVVEDRRCGLSLRDSD